MESNINDQNELDRGSHCCKNRYHGGTHEEHVSVLKYISSLYAIELLRAIDMHHADFTLARLYAAYFATPWQHSPEMCHRFLSTGRSQITQFNIVNAMKLARKLCTDYEDYAQGLVTSVPLDTSIFDLVHRVIDSQHDDIYQYLSRTALNSTSRPIYNNAEHGDNITICDNALVSYFDTFKERQATVSDPSSRHHYKQHRLGILMPHNTVSVDKAMRLVENLHGFLFNPFSSDTGVTVQFFQRVAHILSIAYRLMTPSAIHPNNLYLLYKRYVLTAEMAGSAVSVCRRFSDLSPESVLTVQWHILQELIDEDDPAFQTVSGDRMCGLMSTKINADSLVERYLVTRWLLLADSDLALKR